MSGWKLVDQWLGSVGLFHLLKGFTTYLYRGYNPVTKYQQDIPVVFQIPNVEDRWERTPKISPEVKGFLVVPNNTDPHQV